MNKTELQQFRAEIEEIRQQRRALGEFDAHAGHLNWLLDQIAKIVDHALESYPKPAPKKRGIHK